MTSRKPPSGPPFVEVIRRPAGTSSGPTKAPAPVPAPAASKGPGPAPAPRSTAPVPSPAPRPVGRSPQGPPGEAGGFSGKPRSGPPRFARPSNRPPPTPEQIEALARKEHVPPRIAKGELEGKMRCRIWRKLHAEEARRFDQAYALLDKHPGLELADAFGVVQSGKTVEEFLAKKARGKLKADIQQARTAVDRAAIDGWLTDRAAAKDELAFVLGDRTLLDQLAQVEATSFVLARAGKLEKLQVVLVARRDPWEALFPHLPRDAKLSRKPVAVQRQPDRRPVADPRPLLPAVGKTVKIELRNGLSLERPLLAVGPYDVLMGPAGEELFVPLHAMLSWSVADAGAGSTGA